jgi:hypothetical protein
MPNARQARCMTAGLFFRYIPQSFHLLDFDRIWSSRRRVGPWSYRRRRRRCWHQPSTRAKRGSKLTAVNVIKAIVIFRNMFIPSWKSWLPRTKTVSTARLFQRLTGGSKTKASWVLGAPDARYHYRHRVRRRKITDVSSGWSMSVLLEAPQAPALAHGTK